ncbi:MAG: hypothetical protein K8S27_15510 [Candidatus Omnitrophica bacterium]|nr:hypothetical protein [Candidatus Omnitrophota bacterium]
MIRILIIVGFILIPTPALAGDLMSDIENLQKYNPDIDKYYFVKTYLSALSYLKLNDERLMMSPNLHYSDLERDIPELEVMADIIIQNNTNLRVSRNLVKKFAKSQNGLILKSHQVFQESCEQLISLNSLEIKVLKNLFQAYRNGEMGRFDSVSFKKEIESIDAARKEALTGIFAASTFVSHVLISGQTDEDGDVFQLGIDQIERDKLLEDLDHFSSEGYQGRLRSGQSFIQASIAVIRDKLEDYSWLTFDQGEFFFE